MTSEVKQKIKGKRKSISWLYLILYLLSALVGFLENSLSGLVLGFLSALVCSLVSFFALIPFVGIPLYLILSKFFLKLLTKLGFSAPIAQTFSLYSFLILTIVMNLFISILVAVALLAVISRRKR